MRRKLDQYFGLKLQEGKSEKRSDTAKGIWAVFLVCFFLGIVWTNLSAQKQLSGISIWNTYFLDKFQFSEIRSGDLFYCCLEQRLPGFLLLLIFALGGWGRLAGLTFWGWQGFAMGFLMASAAMAHGLKGVMLALTAYFPHYIIYIPVYVLYIYLAVFWKNCRKERDQMGELGYRKECALFLSCCFLLTAIYLSGIFLESYVNPFFLKKVIKIF